MILIVIIILIFLIALLIGLFVFFKPGLTIEIQKRFYEKINWRIEPISYPKEIRNTKIMGVSLIVMSIFGLIYILKIR